MDRKFFWTIFAVGLVLVIFGSISMITREAPDPSLNGGWEAEKDALVQEVEEMFVLVEDLIIEVEDFLSEEEMNELYEKHDVLDTDFWNLRDSYEDRDIDKEEFRQGMEDLLEELEVFISDLEETIETGVEVDELEVEFIPEEGIESQEIRVVDEEGNIVYQLAIDELVEWIENNWDIFEETPEVGGREVDPSNFGFFDRFASVSPDKKKLVFSVHDYAVATMTSFVIVADLDSGELSMVNEPARGSIEGFVWSGDSEAVAYSLGTGRAAGDFLSVDDVVNMEKKFTLSEEDILELIDYDEELVEVGQFTPFFRDLEWRDYSHGYSLQFTSDDPDNGSLEWLIERDGSGLIRKDLAE